jgi:membrane-associated phospholipid phosphatase
MLFVLVYGAEHYVSDILLGWLYAVVIFLVVNRILDSKRRELEASSSIPTGS